jgi:hypothetical protein
MESSACSLGAATLSPIRDDKLARDRRMSSEHAVLTEGVKPGYSNVILI